MYKLKNVNGRVTALLRTGKDFVRHSLSVSAAQHIIDTGKQVESDKEGYPICVDKQWYFEGEEIKEKPEKVTTSTAYGQMGGKKGGKR